MNRDKLNGVDPVYYLVAGTSAVLLILLILLLF